MTNTLTESVASLPEVLCHEKTQPRLTVDVMLRAQAESLTPLPVFKESSERLAASTERRLRV